MNKEEIIEKVWDDAIKNEDYWVDIDEFAKRCLAEQEKDIKIILDNLKSERFHVKEQGERIEMLEGQISQLEAEIERLKREAENKRLDIEKMVNDY